jgi:protein-disulfide isomerase/uncharacterized membrane protein
MTMRSFSNFLVLLLALAGCVVAGVLTYEEFHPKADIGCSRFGGDCSKTVQSPYGHVGPIPTSLFGLGMYATLAGLCLARHKALRARRAAETSRAETYARMPTEGEDPEQPETCAGALAEGEPLERPELAIAPAAIDSTLPLRAAVKRLDGGLWLIAALGLAISWWLQYVSLYVICSFCPWCFSSATIITLIFLLTSYDFLLEGRKLDGEQKLLAGITAFILVCFGFVAAPVVVSKIASCGRPGAPDIPPPAKTDKRALLVVPYMRYKGDPRARYTLIEFADYQCPHCKVAAAKVEPLLKSPPPGGVRFAFRNFPLDDVHPWARPAAMAAEAAGEQGKFWEMHDKIFEHQSEMGKPGFSREQFDAWAEELGLDLKRFDKDFDSPKIVGRLVNDHVAGAMTGLQLTPTFYLVTPTQITVYSGIEALEKIWKDPKSPDWK